MLVLITGILLACSVLTVSAYDTAKTFVPEINDTTTVDDVVDQVVAACRADGITGEYEMAHWLHDWLIHWTQYDRSLNRTNTYQPEGVLLDRIGVCQSYAEAYQLLLDEVGIENMLLPSDPMDHIWNLVKLDGAWCHIDCTYDDPIQGKLPENGDSIVEDNPTSGRESHNYFGLNDALMQRSHTWVASSEYPQATETTNVYAIRANIPTVTSKEALYAYFRAQTAARASSIDVMYLGTDTSFDIMSLFYTWFMEESVLYGVNGSVDYGGDAYHLQVTGLKYLDKQIPSQPNVPGYAYSLTGAAGTHTFEGKPVILIYTYSDQPVTTALLKALMQNKDRLDEHNVTVILNLYGCTSTDMIPNAGYSAFTGVAQTIEDMESWSYNRYFVNAPSSLSPPDVFVYDADGNISYHCETYFADIDLLLDSACGTSDVPLRGDADGNGQLDQDDVLLLLRHILKMETIVNGDTLTVCDITGDGTLDMVDVVRLQRYVMQISTTL